MCHTGSSQDVIVRRLHSADQVEICDQLRRLNAQSRRARFCGAVSNPECPKGSEPRVSNHDQL